MKPLVFVADDFGLTKSVNDGILEVYNAGTIQGIALMVMADATEDAVKRIKKHSIDHVGLHTSLFSFTKADRKQREDYVNFFRQAKDDEIKKLVYDEIALFEKLVGKKPEFIAPQWNMHGNLRVTRYLGEFALKHNIPMRLPRAVLTSDEITDKNYSAEVMLQRMGVRMPDHLFARILGSSASNIQQMFLDELDTVNDGETTEILFHPSYLDEELLEITSLNFERTRDMAILLDKKFIGSIYAKGFEFIPYSKI